MDKTKNIIKKVNKNKFGLLIGLTIGTLIKGTIGAIAITTKEYSSEYIKYDTQESKSNAINLQEALNELNNKAKAHCPEGKICNNKITNSNVVAIYKYNERENSGK